ncbi:MAG: hypothetical protein JKY37_27420 [Nannocystaceae bacterium]|nr:hypothetical protein [Nannocystaceae bacterium]
MNRNRVSEPTRPSIRRSASLGLAGLLALSACGDSADPETGATDGEASGETDAETNGARQVSYYEHVRPLLSEHCVSCHSDGSIAPFRLDTYQEVAALGPAIAAVIEARTMPPFGVRADGSCRDWADPRWLGDDDIATIAQWVEEGTMEGDPTIEAPLVPQLPTLEGDGIERVALPNYTPHASPEAGFELDDYQCFLVEFDGDEDRYLTGFDVEAGNDKLVHHVLGFRVDPAFLGNGETLEKLDALEAGPGWDCYGAAGEGVLPQGVPVTWAPGQGAVHYPDGVGVRFSPGDVMVVQMHYNLLDSQGMDQTSINLQWADEVEREGFQILWDPFLFSSIGGGGGETLEAGAASVQYAWNASFESMLSLDGLAFDSIDILGLIPHMHSRGRSMDINIDRGDTMACAADVDRYDYNWQRTYFYEDPITVGMGDRLDVVCDFDTTGIDAPVAAGFGTQDEMCLVGIFFAPSE